MSICVPRHTTLHTKAVLEVGVDLVGLFRPAGADSGNRFADGVSLLEFGAVPDATTAETMAVNVIFNTAQHLALAPTI